MNSNNENIDHWSEESFENMPHQESSPLTHSSRNSYEELSSHEVDNHDDPVPQARIHSYLPGTSHPLMPETLLLLSSSSSNKKLKNTSSSSLMEEIPILMLPGVVIFPGTTLPIRLRQDPSARAWRQYLSRKIQQSRQQQSSSQKTTCPDPAGIPTTSTSTVVSFGVLTEITPESQQRSSWIRRGINSIRRSSDGAFIHDDQNNNIINNNNSLVAQEELLQLLLRAMEDDNDSSSSSGGSIRTDHEEEHDPLAGRIGTMVTIINTHGDATTESNDWTQSGTWQHHDDQLVVTALGTGRFRILQQVVQNTRVGRVTNHMSVDRHHHHYQAVPFYRVQYLCDDELPLPSIPRMMMMNPTISHHEQIMNNLAVVSPVPKFVYSLLWPGKLVEEIQSNIQRVQSLEGLKQPSDYSKKGPTAFSFWASSNMPFNETEKLLLLQMECTVERLQCIRSKVIELEQEEIASAMYCFYYCCNRCHALLSPVSHIFTVGGAEGTTGAYVNEYGVIHQTITLRDIQVNADLEYVGLPETRDSWFPGYAWTITYCRRCHNHLGWKFDTTSGSSTSATTTTHALYSRNCHVDEHRPNRFWGFTGSSITTCKVRHSF